MFNAGTMENVAMCKTVSVVMDTTVEPDKQVIVKIQEDSSYMVNGGSGDFSEFLVITVVDNDPGK